MNPNRFRLRSRARLVLAALLAALLGAGCGEEKPAPAPQPAPAGDAFRVRHILIQYAGSQGAPASVKRTKTAADSLARSLVPRLDRGEDFGQLAREFSDDASAAEAGEIAPLQPGETPPDFERQAFALKPGQVSPVFESPYGFHLIQRMGVSLIACQHILIRFRGAVGAPDTLLRGRAEALAEAEKIRSEVSKPGASFPVAASVYSEDTDTASRGGYVGEFVPGKMVKPFADAASALAEGQISGVVETPYGFHIIKRVGLATVKVAQILITFSGTDNYETAPRTREQALQAALDILFRLRKGEDFAELARQYSEDAPTRERGGVLPRLSRGQTVPRFEEAAFDLTPGQISDVVETNFGFHIIKRLQ